MTLLNFSLHYRTKWGESLCLDCCTPEGTRRRYRLHTDDGDLWRGRMEMDDRHERMTYRYAVCDTDGNTLRKENGAPRKLSFFNKRTLYIYDHWLDEGLPSVLLRSAFAECIFKAEKTETPTFGHALLLQAAPPPDGYRWAVAGSSGKLGAWNPSKAPRLIRTGVYEWMLPLDEKDFREGCEYKFIWSHEFNTDQTVWESGPNHFLKQTAETEEGATCICYDSHPKLPFRAWRGAGVVIPVFSLRSKGSFGTGDFGDLLQLVRMAASVGMKAIQLLPVNDTTASATWHDSYPYSGISVCALHPLYIDPREWKETSAFVRHEKEGKRLNSHKQLDYEAAFRLKMTFLRELFNECGGEILKDPAYNLFRQDNKRWLKPYVMFCYLRDLYGTADFHQWGEYARYDAHHLERLLHDNGEARKETSFHSFIQYLLHRQLARVREAAREEGIILKGDLPIGIGRCSVPAWADAPLFHFNGQAGAPPDDFAVNGQNWGFPTYNWEAMATDGYTWWRRRLRHMARYFDAFRIDHVLGFFRIWEIPTDQIYGLLGHFRPALPLTAAEIQAAGFKADVRTLCRASWPVNETERLRQLVDTHALETYFQQEGKRYVLRPELATQRQIEAHIADTKRRNALLDFACEVLFIEDPDAPGCYHPRIAAQHSEAFKRLHNSDKEAFNRLYDDFYYHRHNAFWQEQAMQKLPAVTECTAMLPCAEDLGMVPASVGETLEKLQILSLEIQRMPKHYGVRFDDTSQNPYLSVATIATHDMAPLRLWWKESGEAAVFWHDVLHHEGPAPEEAGPEVCEEVIRMHLESPSMLCLISLQDWLATDARLRHPDPREEQINHPDNPQQYWRYRMHLTLEELAGSTGFNEKIRSLIALSGR